MVFQKTVQSYKKNLIYANKLLYAREFFNKSVNFYTFFFNIYTSVCVKSSNFAPDLISPNADISKLEGKS